MYSDDDLDSLLNGSRPVIDLGSEVRRTVTVMVEESASTNKHRRRLQPVAIGAIVVTLFGGGTATAAAVTGIWAPWAQDDPLAILHYELPSGASCEMRIGKVEHASPEVSGVIRESLRGKEFGDADVIENAFEGGPRDVLVDDNVYQDAYNGTVVAYIDAALSAHGIDYAKLQYSAQANCE